MNHISELKKEARRLLDEVNNPASNDFRVFVTDAMRSFETEGENNFKMRLDQLKQKVSLLRMQSASLFP